MPRQKAPQGWEARPAISVDTSEPVETAYDFSAYGAKQSRQNLYTADYSILGYHELCVVERKTLSDAYGSIASGRERFEDTCRRMGEIMAKPNGYAAIVIEANFDEFVKGPDHSMMNRRSAVNTYVAWSVKYKIPVFFAADRRMGIGVTEALLRHWYDYKIKPGLAASDVEPL